jgi:pimeloyl-ACP methyl ester carboxylesterase
MVHYRDEGPADQTMPVVLLHGTGASLHTFQAWTEGLLQAGHRVLRLDLPGYGLTGPFPQRDYAIDQYVRFLEHFLTALNIDTCVLAGNSLGGHIAWQYAVAYPTRVEKLVLIDAAGYPARANSVPLAFQMAQWPGIKRLFTFITPRFVARASVENVYADPSQVTDELVDRYFELTLRVGNRQAFVDRLGTDPDTTAYRRIPQVRQPTLLLWGEADQLIPVEMAYRFQADLPQDTLVVLAGVGHVPMEEHPQRSLEPVLSFLARSSP